MTAGKLARLYMVLTTVLACGMALDLPASQVQSLQLLGRSSVISERVQLEDADRQWLMSQRTLLLGTAAQDSLPYEVSFDDGIYEGITADYAALIGDLLNVRIEVRQFSSRNAAIRALQAGEIDLLGTSHAQEAIDNNLLTSASYLNEPSVMVTRRGEDITPSDDLAGSVIAIVDRYVPGSAVQAAYPEARVERYQTTVSAVGAVAFGRADAFVGDSPSVSYVINQGYVSNVTVTPIPVPVLGNNFSVFSLNPENQQLLRLVNTALEAIPAFERVAISQRWAAGLRGTEGRVRIQMTEAERRWAEQHAKIKVSVLGSQPPWGFIDEQGDFSGITADVLKEITRVTGLEFDVEVGGNIPELLSQVRNGQSDMLVATTLNPAIGRQLHFTRPYISTPFVMVTRVGENGPTTIDEMAGRKVTYMSRGAVESYLAEYHPDAIRVGSDNVAAAMLLLTQGKVDAAVMSLVSANYYIWRFYRDELAVVSTIGSSAIPVSFGVNRDAELLGILDKALRSLPPESLDRIGKRWRENVLISDNLWMKYREVLFEVSIAALLTLLLSWFWAFSLRRQVQQRKQAEQQLNDQLKFKRALIDGTPHPLYVLDREGRLVTFNSSFANTFLDAKTLVGNRIIDIPQIDHGEAEKFHAECMRVMEQNESHLQDSHIQFFADQPRLAIYQWLTPYADSNGQTMGLIGGWVDISQRERLIEDLRASKLSAEEANRAKTTFLATMSHEIRTPMNAIIGMLEMALKNSEQGHLDRLALEVASNSAKGLLDLIGDILDISQIESGRLSLNLERANLHELVQSLISTFDGMARQKGLHLELMIDYPSPRDVLLDALHFKQILSNLLSNAIKFTEEGKVSFSLWVNPIAGTDRVDVRLRVEDTGIGISEENQSLLFEPFVRVAGDEHVQQGGSGLGLMISRTLCELMNGELNMTSTLGHGTRIDIALSLAVIDPLPATQPLERTLPEQLPESLKVLVVDDYPVNLMLLGKQLSYLSHQVSEAENGLDGLERWRNGQFDVVITDCNMPKMSGYQLAQRIREEEARDGKQPCYILGFTANALSGERERCLAAGMNGCLIKPVSLTDLTLALRDVPAPVKDEAVEDGEMAMFTKLNDLTAQDPDLMRNLLNRLIYSNWVDVVQLRELATLKSWREVAELAHKIKGGALIVNAGHLVTLCESLDSACVTGQPEELIEALVTESEQAMACLNDMLVSLIDRLQ